MASSVSTLVPSDPDKVMLLRRLTPNLLTCSTPFHRFSRIAIGGRGTIVKLASGNLAVFSPVALTPQVKTELHNLSPGKGVRYITALDQEHHIFVSEWLDAYPEATVLAPETLPELRKKQGYPSIPDAQWKLFRKDRKTWTVSEEFDREFDMEYVPAHANHELVFNHRPSRTLIEADLLFNLPATEQHSKTGDSGVGFLGKQLTRFFTAINNTSGEALWQRRFIWYAISAGDRQGYNQSIGRIAGWDFERIIPCHGNVIETGGKGIFEKVMRWHLEAGRKGQ